MCGCGVGVGVVGEVGYYAVWCGCRCGCCGVVWVLWCGVSYYKFQHFISQVLEVDCVDTVLFPWATKWVC